jgi:hypothetical protein
MRITTNKQMDNPGDILQTLVASLYLIGATLVAYVGWVVIKLFKFITPKASKVVDKIVSEWIIDLLKPIIHEAIEQKLGSKLDDMDKIKEATHGRSGAENNAIMHLIELGDRLEKKINKLEKNEKDS